MNGPHLLVFVRALPPKRTGFKLDQDLYHCQLCGRQAVWVHGILTGYPPVTPKWPDEPCPKNILTSGLEAREVHDAYASDWKP